MLNNLVGQTVRLSSKNRKTSEQNTRVLYISGVEYGENCKRYYSVTDKETGAKFYADANIYDSYFLVNRQKIAPKNYRETIQNKSQIGYKK